MDPNETPDPLAAMDAGIAAASEPAAAPEPAPVADESLGDPAPVVAAAEPAKVEPEPAAPVPGTPEALAAAQAAEAAATAAPAAPKPDEATEAEITSLGLKEKSAERFRELASEVKSLAPLKDALAAAGITDIAALPTLVSKAKNADELIDMVTTTGSTPQQFGDALNYLTLVNKAAQGDRAAAEQAYEMMSRELAVLAQNLGKEVPGIHDPLAAHADLQQAIEANTITRQHALEIAQGRVAQVQQRQVGDQRQQQEQFQQAAQTATTQLAQLDAALAADPAYALRRPALSAAVAEIKRRVPPSQWVAATQAEYQRLAMIPVALPQPAPAPKPAVPVGPVRAVRAAPALIPTTDDPFEAMSQGIAAASG